MKRAIYLLVVLMAALSYSTDADAQLLKRLGERVKNTVENKVLNKAEEKTSDEMDDVLGNKKSNSKSNKQNAEAGEEEVLVGEVDPTAATSSDFKRGDVILFQDDVTNELVGEFPSKWDLFHGSAEVKTLGGVKAIEITNDGQITPLIEEVGAYLPEEFTVEYEFFYWNEVENVGLNDLKLVLANNTDRSEWTDYYGRNVAFSLLHGVQAGHNHSYYYNRGTDESTQRSNFEYRFKQGWHKVALSFNKRALKVYFDGNRVVNLPRVQQPTWLSFQVPYDHHNLTFIRNIVIAKGAVELYERQTTEMSAVEKAIAETGKFVTNNILFETGKATLKPESMEEIQKVADYMLKNTSARFEVQGHTDSQGSDAINDPLSQQRAEAVVKALEGLGVDGFNLRAVGKGSHEPVADNKTEEGRAQNRRVEFIKK